jgi:ATP-binding cassette subfamily C protein EexD
LPQDIELFEGTVGENIARFAEVDSAKVILAAMTAGVHEMILLLPDGYDTVIGSEGIMLSAGQRQRIGLARALYGSPRLIILDEPNSNLDDIGDRALAGAVQQLKQTGATLFVITHRTNIVSQLDRLMVLNAGVISIYGPREHVLAELNAQRQQAQTPAVPATSGVASVDAGKGESDEPCGAPSSN